jgi:SAM-dependent methyltransferase
MASHIERRKFLGTLGGAAAAWPLAARAQQAAMPVIGFLHSGTAAPFEAQLAAFQQGLKEGNYVVGQNVVIEYRAATNSHCSHANGRVHEVGVGSGLNVPLYGKQVEFVFGIDPSPRLLAIARRRAAPRPVSAPLSPEPEDGRPYPLGRFRHDEPSNRIRKRATSNDLHVPRRGTIGGMILRL